MLKKYTNLLRQQIREAGLDPLAFVSSHEDKNGYPTFVVHVKNAPLYFRARSVRTEPDDLFNWAALSHLRLARVFRQMWRTWSSN